MYSKKEILGVRCEIIASYENEAEILIGGSKFFVKPKNLHVLPFVEKFAVLGESPFYLSKKGFVDFIGPRWCKRYLVHVNSRGYSRKAFVNEKDLVLLDGKLAA